MRPIYFIFAVFLFTSVGGEAQELSKEKSTYFKSPFDFKLYLSGSFAELRANHFHGGIDIKTGGVTGKSVKASAGGYVSRIKVSPWGYGNALYISHPNGMMTVYGHLKSYNKKIAQYVKEQQYIKKSFSVNLFPDKNMFPIKQGDIIALSGNSGGSGGPHLHFEIREKDGTVCLNPLKFGIPVEDHIPPVLKMLGIYAANDSSVISKGKRIKYFNLKTANGICTLSKQGPIKLFGDFAFGLSTFDRQSNSHNKNGVYQVVFWIDGKKVYESSMDAMPFAHNYCLNSFIDYPYYIKKKKRIQRTWKEYNNELSCFNIIENNGVFSFRDGKSHQVMALVKDYAGNQTKLKFLVSVDSTIQIPLKKIPEGQLCCIGMPAQMATEKANLFIPLKALFKQEYISLIEHPIDTIKKAAFAYPTWEVGKKTIPCAKSFTLTLDAQDIPDEYFPYSYIARVDKKGRKSYASSRKKSRSLVLKTKKFGTYTFALDTIGPKIKPIGFYNGKNVGKHKIIRFKISDYQTGIASYTPKLNGEWLLMTYDPKKAQIIYYVDERLKKGSNLLEIEVEDNLGNISREKYSLVK